MIEILLPADISPAFAVCTTAMDKYVKIRKIGEGAFGVAHLARYKDLKDHGKQVVLKEINMTRVSC